MNPLADFLADFLADPGRAPFAGAAPAVSWRQDDDADWQRTLAAAGAQALELARRGRSHGRIALLPAALGRAQWPRPSQARHLWERARPMRLADALGDGLRDWRNELHRALLRADDVSTPAGLGHWLGAALGGRGARFSPGPPLDRTDAERDIGRVAVRDGSHPVRTLWVKSARLSTFAGDTSLRLRFGFGAEGADDGSLDEPSHRAVAALARAACPEIALVEGARELWSLVESAAGAKLYPTGAIVYWNAPQGGARMHHDAFRPDDGTGQRGVLYTQLVGRTFWLTLSSADLGRRLVEFAELVLAGEMPWLRGELDGVDFEALAALGDDPRALADELGQPDQGRWGKLVDRGPEFTLFLVDSGHGVLLDAGDAILLPNHGLARTALHSVFCASGGRTLAASFGLRLAR